MNVKLKPINSSKLYKTQKTLKNNPPLLLDDFLEVR